MKIFVDPDGDCHYYKVRRAMSALYASSGPLLQESEFNAANATWDLILNRPYGKHPTY